jgi:cytochrome c-type biogenesis protein CcmH/NrfG
LPYFIRALELDPDNSDARYYYARALLDTADIPGARTQLYILIDKRPDHAEARALLSEIGN